MHLIATAFPPLLLLALAGCGYQQSNLSADTFADSELPASTTRPSDAGLPPAGGYKWGTLYRGDVRTVAVPIFTNRTFYRGVEFGLSKAVVNQIEAQSPYKVVPRERADSVVEGEIVRVRTRMISEATTALPQEQLYLLTVDFTWKDLRTGREYVRRKNFEQTAPWYPLLGEGRFVAEQQSIERLGLAIVQELQAEW